MYPAVIIAASLEPADSVLINFCQCFSITSTQKIASNIFVPKTQAEDLAGGRAGGLSSGGAGHKGLEPKDEQVFG